MKEAVIVAYQRSPFHFASKGALIKVRPDDLAAAIVKAIVEKSGNSPSPGNAKPLPAKEAKNPPPAKQPETALPPDTPESSEPGNPPEAPPFQEDGSSSQEP